MGFRMIRQNHTKGILERPQQVLPRPGEIAAHVDRHNTVNGLIAFLFAVSGPLAILLAVATKGGLSETDINSWIFAGYGIGGGLSILFSLIYRQPIGMAWTIPGAVLLGPALGHLEFSEIIGAYLITGVVITVMGFTGWIRRGMAVFPMAIVMGMVSGVFLPFCLNMVAAFMDAPWIALSMVAAFMAVLALPTLAKGLPPILGALIVGVLVTLATDNIGLEQPLSFSVVRPHLYLPAFSIKATLELVIPLTITVIVIQNAQGLAILKEAGFEPPVNTLTVACGVGSLLFGIFGAVPTCVTGPVNAILNSSGAKQRRYVGGITFGILLLLFGLFSPVATRLGLSLPPALIGMLGGLAMIRVLQTAMTTAFGGHCPLGALVTFIVAFSDIVILNIGSAFWGLIFGFVTSWVMERDDLRQLWESG
jgi:benzoate membrane transport protein